ncbi:ShlB/FhaC/HecB family hemolysin secretion/activation protein [Spirulina sp. CS-785/01]|uniref:ShlB/FhaC/HecB family hemolysin secretion/activation protein n=1 Tax=Spirulina sp. CS-785/01 TaxID=3021716 RepID=UPI00232AD137|nr:ShlB/FhaC/HecB family hemolysin secretion/activation protein [Spirulina sp. CS-785/01]MDB9311901.1 ShlB/FhaC/HecB family hemolysin secretion/activation protein [Spirulina sp. CS-785/01]
MTWGWAIFLVIPNLTGIEVYPVVAEEFEKSPKIPVNAPTVTEQLDLLEYANRTPFPLSQTPPRDEPPSTQPLPEPDIPQLPLPEELFDLPDTSEPSRQPTPTEPTVPEKITVEQFEIVGSTIFTQEDFAPLLQPYLNRPLSLAELLEARSRITQFYLDRGYITTGALIPAQDFADHTVTIQVVEGKIEAINVIGTTHLNPNYVRNRLQLATDPPLNVNELQEALQLLQLDPLITNLSAELSAGTKVGFNILDVQIREADTFSLNLPLNNNRSPTVGSFRRGVSVTEANLLGIGDRINANYSNTDGSNSLDLNYTIPINPRNGTIRFAYGETDSEVIEDPFKPLNITSDSVYYELSLRQPLIQTPTQEFALTLALSQQESQSEIGLFNIPLVSEGDNPQGRSKVTALRFIQEWTKRSERQVLAARSQFSWGLDWFNATENPEPPDSHFFSWRGQAQWVRLLGPDTLLLIRGDMQIADRPLLSLEQFSLGGQTSVRGYRQDLFFHDNGLLASAEVRIPILRIPDWQGVLQIVPFFDAGWGWDQGITKHTAITGTGLGLRLQQGNNLTIRLDWGVSLSDVDSSNNTLQENGFYFSVNYRLF